MLGEWLEVEKMFDPRKDLFMILGQKIEIFAKNGKRSAKYVPTVHRVVSFLLKRRIKKK